VRKIILLFVLGLIQSLLLSQEASASCLANSGNERLTNYCLAQVVSEWGASPQSALMIDARLKREGYANGLGFPSRIDKHDLTGFVTPIIDYSDNINGGNPDKPLVLGGLKFTGDPDLIQKAGVLLGARVGFYGRSIVGEGNYIDHQASVSYEHAPQHGIGIKRLNASVCSKNHLGGLLYADLCAAAGRQIKQLSDQKNQTLNMTMSKIIRIGNSSFNEVKLGALKNYNEGFNQKQIAAGIDTIFANGLFSSATIRLGEAVSDELALRKAASLNFGYSVKGKPVSMSLSISDASGSQMIGVARRDITKSIDLVYGVTPKVSLSVGYENVDSSIDYFDVKAPKFGIRFSAIKF